MSRNFKFHSNLTIIHEDQHIFMIRSRSVLLKMRNVSVTSCKKNHNANLISINKVFFRKSCRLWDSVGMYGNARQSADVNTIPRI